MRGGLPELAKPQCRTDAAKDGSVCLSDGVPWFAVYAQTPRESMEKIDAATHREIGNNQDLARQLGGTSFVFKGPDLVSTIAAFVKEYGITHLIMGRVVNPGIVAGSANRCSTGSCKRYPGST